MHRHLTALFALLALAHSPVHAAPGGIEWQTWSEAVFERAKAEKRFVLLDLEAVWCHWCHVMDEKTYADPKVIDLVGAHYVAVKVDQDSRPDLASRYQDYGWPATIVFDASGAEIVKRSGFIPPGPMASMLQAIVDDPSPGPSVLPEAALRRATDPFLTPTLAAELARSFRDGYDRERAGWGSRHKLLDAASVEYGMALARDGDAGAGAMARQTLDAALRLIDPVWGGAYQYSTGGDWKEPHFEKIASTQADNLRLYSLAYSVWGEPHHLEAARRLRAYLKAFWTSPGGAFYTSQDADVVRGEHGGDYFALADAERRKRGIPRIDTHVYARENGWLISALAAFYAATGEADALADARRAADWIVANRALPGGGFRHDERDAAGPYLGDSLAMGRALLSLYFITAERRWLDLAEGVARFIDGRFRVKIPGDAGFATAAGEAVAHRAPKPDLGENVEMARLSNLLFRATGNADYRTLAERAMRYLATPEVATSGPPAGVLVAALELGREPAHVTVVGAKNDPAARSLFLAALTVPTSYKRTEWWDRSEGPLPNSDVAYPELGRVAAFACSEGRCSLPAFSPRDLRDRIERITKRPQ